VHSDEPVMLRLDKRGEGPVTAADLSTTADVEILNGDLHLAYLTNAKSALTFELTVERGKGYVGAEGNKGSSTIGVIPWTRSSPRCVGSASRSSRFASSSPRTSTDGDRDRDRRFDQPREALASAGKTSVHSLTDRNFDDERPPWSGRRRHGPGRRQRARHPHRRAGLTERSRNCLKRAGINTIAQLVNATERDLTSITTSAPRR